MDSSADESRSSFSAKAHPSISRPIRIRRQLAIPQLIRSRGGRRGEADGRGEDGARRTAAGFEGASRLTWD